MYKEHIVNMVLEILAVALVVFLLFSQRSSVEGFARGFALRDADPMVSDTRIITHKKPLSRLVSPIIKPEFNIREMSKQMTLLEKYLLEKPHDRCKDCIRKYFLTIEALAEEVIGADTNVRFGNSIQKLPDFIREIQRQWSGGMDYAVVAQKIRKMRQILASYSFDSIL